MITIGMEAVQRTKIDSFLKEKIDTSFEKTSRKYKDDEVCDFFLANFVNATDNPQGVWIGNMIRSGEVIYKDWQRRQQSLFYNFKQSSENMFSTYNLEEFFDASKGHPPILKEHLAGNVSVEEMCIYEKLFSYCKDYDVKIDDLCMEVSRQGKLGSIYHF